ncbi:hypothetical protein [Stutzerimonas stutzeri]|uniref:hypothetical protein n=1 Tax=Stutzerimonas stutzeri TaxID=316 RepID=UPI002446EDE1|nr:hypothetical protein [Stutzerimonas stutzeri]MDH0085271.1 hypothetical protein [Stutzerimonas stutzeri]
MSTFSLTRGSEAALGMLASQAGSETLLLTQPARELRAELSIEPFTSESGDQLLAVLFMREQRHSMTLQRDDGANVQHLADWIEAVANGTLDTAEAIPQRATPAPLLPCSKCNGVAIGYDYSPAGSAFIHGVRCRHRTCQAVEGAETEAEAHDAWNAIQLEQLADPSDLQAATAAFNAAAHELNAQTEPAPAQDEREAFEAARRIIVEVRRSCADTDFLVPVIARMLARPAQTEQQPVGHVYTMQPCFPGEPMRAHAQLHVALPAGTKLYAAPIAPTAQQPEQSGLEQALALAAARLDRLGLNQPVHSKAYREARDWADEAMVALRDYRAALATSPTA